MKKVILAAFLTITPAMANAEETPCEIVGQAARTTMELRQNNTPMSALMARSRDSELMRQMVILAYDQPAYLSDRAKQESIDQFGNQMELICYKGGF
jgi:HSP90 family molecular chaperone